MAYLVSKKPVLDDKGQVQKWETMQRFVLPQDTGSAIKGAGRADLFWGNGHYAEIAAGNMKEGGQLYFLVKKEEKNARTDRIALATQLTGLP
jgi:membrane-bound lytic murein transglycosylase A